MYISNKQNIIKILEEIFYGLHLLSKLQVIKELLHLKKKKKRAFTNVGKHSIDEVMHRI